MYIVCLNMNKIKKQVFCDFKSFVIWSIGIVLIADKFTFMLCPYWFEVCVDCTV